ncbi:AMP-binding protein [Stieleria sp. JC731]|uniref:AMP-binding protein n=1 Tax=Pirellulaceae TaxID=2691357 RepID=UPI001E453066|nr:AMP-binding protein [Stieleria sp. JC731]MCC9601180.1 AMP-binding protein [Stieleria sp. JC731]
MMTTSLPECVRQRASRHGDRTAVTFLSEDYFSKPQSDTQANSRSQSLTYAELYAKSLALASALRKRHLDGPIGDGTEQPRVALLFPPSIESIIALLGTQLAGCIPVPSSFPRPHREIPRLNASADDCHPAALLTDQATFDSLAHDKLAESLRCKPIIAIDSVLQDSAVIDLDAEDAIVHPNATSPEAIALLQYTSGSTSAARGVVLRHRHLMSNLESIRQGFGLELPSDQCSVDDPSIDVGVFWLPFYHDMGLIGGVLAPLYIGGHTVLMSPRAFLARPIRWLQAISEFGASISGAPNFAYQLCVDRIPSGHTSAIDLSKLRLAFCGAEPIQARTLDEFSQRFSANGFKHAAFYPCYGLAEATLLVAGGKTELEPTTLTLKRDDFQKGLINPLDKTTAAKLSRKEKMQLVGCGSQVWNTEIRIVDPATLTAVSEGMIGEIWVKGGSVSQGYWETQSDVVPDGKNDDLQARFNVSLASGENGFCRSGDLGFIYNGDLYVTGRLKEMIILRGRNLYPQDIEATVRLAVEQTLDGQTDLTFNDLAMCRSAAFAVAGNRGESLAIVVEMPRQLDQQDELSEMARAIRHRIIDVHDVDPQHIWLVRPATIAVTTSGKIRRVDCRASFEDNSIKTRFRYDRSAYSEQAPIQFPTLPSEPLAKDQPKVQQDIEDWMAQWLIARAGVNPDDYCRDRPLSDFGLDSMSAVELSGETEDWTGVALTPEVATDNPSVESLSRFIANGYIASRAI